MADPHAPRVDGDRLHGRGAYDMKAGVAAALLACREAARLGLAGDVVVAAVADEEHASLGVQEALRAVERRRRDRHRADRARGRGRAQGLRLGRDRGHRARRPRLAAAAGRRRDREDRARSSPRSGSSTRALGERTHPLLGRGSVHASLIEGGEELRATRRAAWSASSAARCRARRRRAWRPSSRRCSTRCRAADPELAAEQRTLLVREPFEVAQDAEIVAAVRAAAAESLAAPPRDRRRELLGRRRFIAAAGSRP